MSDPATPLGADARRAHWERVYAEKGEDALSWFEPRAETSLALLDAAGIAPRAVVDIGAGTSRFVDALIERGVPEITLLDLSETALARTRERLGPDAAGVHFVAADVTTWTPDRTFDLWHDRAAFHFLTDPEGRAAYLARLATALRPGGHALIATFAADGPERCSGLPVRRTDPEDLAATLGPGYALVDARRIVHRTPWGSEQRFQASLLRRA
ncbi:class I SAM-dependent methyltransferase [Salinarimonas rosea]|uniref:class I SAM-dependent methyltransferase n=1 Tax=Salinarimonas rosea TaxID=552063 RepID=UPI0003FE0619|nr:class I SAM-dependent methyltransferase [Salinarimonas rosea]